MSDIEEAQEARRLYRLLKPYFPSSFGISVRVFNSAAIAIVTATNTLLTFNTETYDTSNMHDTGSNTGRITMPVGGTYLITGHVEFASNATGFRQIYIQRNGAEVLADLLVPAVNGAVTILSLATLFLCNAADYVELGVSQNSGGNLNVDAVNYYSPYFAAVRVP